MRTRRSGLRTAALLAAPALLLVGCSKADQAAAGTAGEGVAVGATAEDYQAALADMEPVELTYQVSAASAESTSGQREVAFADAVEEMSGGKITLDVVYSNAVVPPDEIASALGDGRLDLAHWLTSYHADEMKAFTDLQDALVSVETSPLQGEIVSHFTAQEVAFNTPEIMEEFESHGMTVLNPYNTFGSTALACTSEKGSPDDFDGDQIRANAAAQTQQIEALGGSAVTLQLAETYEGLQRNVLQCTFGSPTSMVMSGWLETAGNVYVPKDSSFVSGPGSIVAGSSWGTLPLAAQQLIYDQMVAYNTGELGNAYVSAINAADAAAEQGSGMHFLDAESEAALEDGNEKILGAVAESENLDGEKLLTDVEEAAEKWAGIADELGYTDEGDYLDFSDWYAGNGDVVDPEYVGPIVERFYEEVLAEHRPS
jgi:TRAP-type C4-dicarboxylate transport system substrate-binding protein